MYIPASDWNQVLNILQAKDEITPATNGEIGKSDTML